MTYKEKLNICPACKKAHGLSVKEKAKINSQHYECKVCKTRLRSNYFDIMCSLLVVIALNSYFNSKQILFFDWHIPMIIYLVIMTAFNFFASLCRPLKIYRNYWAEFWDKGL